MTFQTEIFQGMFSTIIIIQPCKVLCKSAIFTILLFYQFCNVPLSTLAMIKMHTQVSLTEPDRKSFGTSNFWRVLLQQVPLTCTSDLINWLYAGAVHACTE